MIKKLEHVGIFVSDLDRSIEFYKEVFGLKLRHREFLNEQVELAFLFFPNDPNVEVELVGGRRLEEIEGKVNHLAFTVNSIEEEINRLQALNVEMVDTEPKAILQNKVKIAFFKGPDGEKLELVER